MTDAPERPRSDFPAADPAGHLAPAHRRAPAGQPAQADHLAQTDHLAQAGHPTLPGGLSLPARILVITGIGLVVAGGLVAAVTGPLDLDRGSWVAAYLVLVCGVGQVCLGLAQAAPGTRPLTAGTGWAQLVCWALGNVLVVVGTLIATTARVTAGAVLLVVALVIALVATRGGPVASGATGRSRSLLLAYRGVLVVLVLGAPVGVLLSHLRHGA